VSDPLVSREAAAIGASAATAGTASWRHYAGIVIPMAAALVLIVVRPWQPRELETPHRAPVTGAAIPVAHAPVGTVASADTFRWGAVASADRYRLTLFDSTGGIAFETEQTDTVVLLPDSIVLAVGRRYLWRVDARVGWERWSRSALVEFLIGGTSR
jgi:hypothetical protein